MAGNSGSSGGSTGGLLTDIFSQMFQNLRGDYWHEQDQTWSEENQKREHAFQREMAQHGIRWRVQDAIAAGIHPLYALGGPSFQSSPAPVTAFGDSGGADMGKVGHHFPWSRSMTDEEKEGNAVALQGARARANKDEAEAAYWNARTMREYRDMDNPSAPSLLGGSGGSGAGGSGVTVPWWLQSHKDNLGAINLSAAPTFGWKDARNPHLTGGVNPMWQEHALHTRNGKTYTVWLPPGNEAWPEKMGENFAATATIVGYNLMMGKGKEIWELITGREGNPVVKQEQDRARAFRERNSWMLRTR